MSIIEVYGIGNTKMKELNKIGIFTVNDLREYIDLLNPLNLKIFKQSKFKISKSVKAETNILNSAQILGLKWYEDIQKPIPRSMVHNHFLYMKSFIPMHIFGKNAMVTGSFRRGLSFVNDIDLVITTPLTPIIEYMQRVKYIIGVLSSGYNKWSGIVRIPTNNARSKLHQLQIGELSIKSTHLIGDNVARRLDIITTTPSQYWFAVLYFTGSKIFNIHMRKHAKKMGYKLDETGLYKNGKNVLVPHNEVDIFDVLKMKYTPPNLRNK